MTASIHPSRVTKAQSPGLAMVDWEGRVKAWLSLLDVVVLGSGTSSVHLSESSTAVAAAVAVATAAATAATIFTLLLVLLLLVQLLLLSSSRFCCCRCCWCNCCCNCCYFLHAAVIAAGRGNHIDGFICSRCYWKNVDTHVQ